MLGRKIRVGVSGHDLKFWYPLQRALEQTGRYEFREDVWSGHDQHDEERSKAVLDWADVLVAEWALGNAVYYSRRKLPHQRLMVRLHLQERGTEFPADIEYGNVDWMLFVGAHILRECVEKFSIPEEKCKVLGNFVDVSRYAMTKFGGAEYTLGMVGTAPSRKRLDLALDTLELLADRDDRYALRVKGANPASIPWLWARSAEREYYQQVYSRINRGPLRHRVIFDPQGDDVHHWFKMIGAVLSPSDFESFHMAVAEGAASGAIPVVWSWEGASEIYPEFVLVRDAKDAADQIEFNNLSASGWRYREQVREIIASRYDSSVIMKQWDDVLSEEERSMTPATALAGRSPRRVLVVWAIDNWKTFHRREMLEALASNLSDHYDVLVVEPGNHYETIQKLGWSPAAEMQKLARGELVREGENLYRTRLFTGAVPGRPAGSPAGYQGGDYALKVLDGLLALHYPDSQVLHWVYKPDQALRMGSRDFVYEVYDDYAFDFGTGEPIASVLEAERAIMPAARHVFFTSRPLLERKAGYSAHASLVGNGVNFAPFARFRPRAVETRGRPVAGYLGNLSDFFDWDLMREVCRDLPEVDFVFHGQIEDHKLGPHRASYESLRTYPNVRFSGRVSREQGAACVARYDVLMIPFVVNEAMHAVNPLKLWEYYATGKPVVSTPMDAIEEVPPHLIVAEGAEAWRCAIREALEGEMASPDVAAQRVARAGDHRWEELTRAHAEILIGLVPEEAGGSRTGPTLSAGGADSSGHVLPRS